MTTKHILVISVLVIIFCGQVIAETSECVLPVPDGGVNPSPPSVQGVIASVGDGQITLKGANEVQIILSNETQLFTVYGGIVFAQEIKEGQHVFVWYVGCKESPMPVAAVIQFCSTEAEPCLK